MITTGIGIMIGITIAIEIMTQAALLHREVICVAAGRRLFAATISLPFAKLRMVHGVKPGWINFSSAMGTSRMTTECCDAYGTIMIATTIMTEITTTITKHAF